MEQTNDAKLHVAVHRIIQVRDRKERTWFVKVTEYNLRVQG